MGAFSFYSKDINKNKFNEFVKKATDIRDFKNSISLHFSQNLTEISELSKIDVIKRYGVLANNAFTSSKNIRGQELQKAVVDVLVAYENRFDTVKDKIQFKIQSKSKVSYYKGNTQTKRKGDIKEYSLVLKSTKLTRLMTYISRYASEGIALALSNKLQIETDANKRVFFEDCLNFLNKFGEERILKLALSRRYRFLKRYSNPIHFKRLSYRSQIQSEGILLKNHKGYANSMGVIMGMNGRKLCVPVSFGTPYHDHLNQFKIKEYNVVVEENRIRFILFKEVSRKYSIGNTDFMGVDTNIKHNLFSTSLDKTVDLDRGLFKRYVNFLQKYDKHKERSSVRHFNLWQTRVQTMLKQKASELVDIATQNGKNHIVMEDLSNFGKSLIRSDEYVGFKYSRLVKLLNLGSLNTLVRGIAQKKGIQLTIIHSHYTSQMCSRCGHISKQNRKTQEDFKCVVCSHELNADLNSSFNIHLLGQQEVLSDNMLKEDSSSWYIPKKLNKELIRYNREDIVTSLAFQQNRKKLFEFIYFR